MSATLRLSLIAFGSLGFCAHVLAADSSQRRDSATTKFATRFELAQTEQWDDVVVPLVAPGLAAPTSPERHVAKAIHYRRSLPLEQFYFVLVSDPYSRQTFVTQGG